MNNNDNEVKKYYLGKTLRQICFILSMLLASLFVVSCIVTGWMLVAELVNLYNNVVGKSTLVIFASFTVLSLLFARLFAYLGGFTRGRN